VGVEPEGDLADNGASWPVYIIPSCTILDYRRRSYRRRWSPRNSRIVRLQPHARRHLHCSPFHTWKRRVIQTVKTSISRAHCSSCRINSAQPHRTPLPQHKGPPTSSICTIARQSPSTPRPPPCAYCSPFACSSLSQSHGFFIHLLLFTCFLQLLVLDPSVRHVCLRSE
jgi:hypothetical protein